MNGLCDWVLSLSIMSSWFIHIVPCMSTSLFFLSSISFLRLNYSIIIQQPNVKNWLMKSYDNVEEIFQKGVKITKIEKGREE